MKTTEIKWFYFESIKDERDYSTQSHKITIARKYFGRSGNGDDTDRYYGPFTLCAKCILKNDTDQRYNERFIESCRSAAETISQYRILDMFDISTAFKAFASRSTGSVPTEDMIDSVITEYEKYNKSICEV